MRIRPSSGRHRSAVHPATSQSLIAAAVAVAVAAALPAQVAPGLQFAELGKRHLPADTDWTFEVAYADVDGDGDLDLLIGNDSRQNRLYLNDGTGTFTDATAARMPVDNDRTRAIALGDIDGDSDFDLVIGNNGQQNRLYLNNGSGTFTDATATRMPVDSDYTTSMALGDVDGDGDLDLVIGNYGQQNLLYLNDGAGTFTRATAAQMPPDADETHSVALGDVDRDGDLDIVLANRGGSSGGPSRLYLNNGRGTFTVATSLWLPAIIATAVVMGDMDRDGDLDLVLHSGFQSRLFLNDGSGTFRDATATRMPAGNLVSYLLTLGDVDGDGDLDLVLGHIGNQNRLYLNDGTATFTDATATRLPVQSDVTYSMALGDADGDGDLDLVIGNAGYQNRLYLNDGTGTFVDTTPQRLPVQSHSTNSVTLGDVDGDGDHDLILGNSGYYPEVCRLYLNDGSGTFTDATASRMPPLVNYTRSVALGDVDRDGDLDVMLGTAWRTQLYVNDGTGTFTDATALRMPQYQDSSESIALGDVDGDGDLDLALAQYSQCGLYLNTGTGHFTDASAARMPFANGPTRAVGFADVDGDGDLDLILAGIQERLFLNNGSGSFTDATAARMPVDNTFTFSLASSDVDQDGDLDLVLGNHGQNRLYLNDGTGRFTDATAARMPVDSDASFAVALGDLDGDGDLDLVIGNSSYLGQQNRLYLNDGTGTFTDATATRIAVDDDLTTSIALGDVDADGDLDVVFGVWGRSRLFVNLERQLEAPYMLRAGHAYTLEVYSRHGPSRQADGAIVYLSTVRLSVPLPPFGILGIDPMAPLAPVLIPQPAGVGVATWNVPSIPSLAGVEVFAQALFVRWPLDLRLSNVTADVFLR